MAAASNPKSQGLFKGMNVERKPKTARGRRILKQRAPKVVENPKSALILKGARSSEEVNSFLVELQQLKKPMSVLFSRKHPEHPFESTERIEKLCAKSDHSLFCLGSSSKKRPFRAVFGRLFDHQVLDMQEFGVTNYMPSNRFKGAEPPQIGSKPLLVFQGSGFDMDPQLKQSKSLLMDFFRGANPERIALNGLDHALVFTTENMDPAAMAAGGEAAKKKVLVRHYRIGLKRSGTKLPYVEMEELGPSFDLVLDRIREPDKGMWKAALKRPKGIKPKKVKNVSTTAMGERLGRIHVNQQEYDKIHTVHGGKKRKKAGERKSAADDGSRKKLRGVPDAEGDSDDE